MVSQLASDLPLVQCFEGFFKIVGEFFVVDKERRGLLGDFELIECSGSTGRGEVRGALRGFFDIAWDELDGGKVGLGEVAVVFGVFLEAHEDDGTGFGVEAVGAVLDVGVRIGGIKLDLAADFRLEGLFHVGE